MGNAIGRLLAYLLVGFSLIALAAPISANAQATVKLVGPTQTTYTAPASYGLQISYTTTTGPKAEYVRNMRLTQNGALLSNVATGTFTVSGQPPGTYDYMLTAEAVRNLDGDEVVRQISSGPVHIVVNAPPAPIDAAQVISTSIPSPLIAGRTVAVSIQMKNVGQTTWASGYYLSAPLAGERQWWGVGNIPVQGEVAPGQTATFNFNITPSASATTYTVYTLTLQMAKGADTWFGGSTGAIAVELRQPVNGASFKSQSVPAEMITGRTYSVAISMWNTGYFDWTSAARYALGSFNPNDNGTWGLGRVPLPATVPMQGIVNFAFNVTAPSAPGSYNFQWRMVQDGVEWFGAHTPNVVVNVRRPINSAAFVSQTVNGSMLTGQSQNVTVRMRNDGETTWSGGGAYRLGAVGAGWAISRVSLPRDVAPGESVDFNFALAAPALAGSYGFQWRMVQDGVEWFGATTPNVTVGVRKPINSALFVSQVVPSSIPMGEGQDVIVRIRNNGDTTWTSAAGYSLGSVGAQWGIDRVGLPGNIPPGGEAQFSFRISAPISTGTYAFQWQMVQDGVEWFGDRSTQQQVAVSGQPLRGLWTDYDALGRVTVMSQDSELGLLVTTSTYLSNNSRRVTDPRGQTSTITYQAFGHPDQRHPVVIDGPEGTVTEIARDRYAKPLAIERRSASGSASLSRRYVYGPDQRLCKAIEPETGATVFSYDVAGNLSWTAAGLALPSTTQCDIDSGSSSEQRVDRIYDKRNRVQHLVFSDGSGDQTWEYTPTGLPLRIRTSGGGDSPEVINTYTYAKRGLLIAETSGLAGRTPWALGYAYNPEGSLAGITYPSGEFVSFAPDALGRPTRAGNYAFNARYFPNGNLRSLSYGNGLTRQVSQNARGLPSRVVDSASAIDDSISYDANGNVTAVSDGTGTGKSRAMEYDGLNRLRKATSPGFGGNGVIEYDYDPLDNMITNRLGGVRDHRYWYDVNNRLTNVIQGDGTTIVGLSYDAQGNLVNRNGQTFSYDHGRRMKSADGLESYRYDGWGRRTLAIAGDGEIASMYGQDGLLRRQSNARDGMAYDYVYLAGKLVATVSTPVAGGIGTTKYQHVDFLGSPVAVTGSGGSLENRAAYEPFGKPVLSGQGGDGPAFGGHVSDSKTGLLYMGQRYYDVDLGRFLGVDPVTALDDPQRKFNRYIYGQNRPYNFIDPDGRDEEWFSNVDPMGNPGFGNELGDDAFAFNANLLISAVPASNAVRDLLLVTRFVIGTARTAESATVQREVVVDSQRYPESAAHIRDAQASGQPSVLTVNRAGARDNRREAMQGQPVVTGKDRDEYPPAMFSEGGAGASVRPISPSDNRGSGACIGAQCKGLPEGAKIRIKAEP